MLCREGGLGMEPLIFGLAKGRLAKHTMQVLQVMGITCQEMDRKSRKLIFESDDKKYRFFLAKASDVPTYVDYGACDLGIVGKDTIVEEDRNVYEVLDLGCGECRMVVAGDASKRTLLQGAGRLWVATKYPAIAKAYFEKRCKNVEIIKLNGSVELGPIVGLSDVIVDIVESGATLKENGLVVLEEIMPLSARVIVNPASMKVKNQQIQAFIKKMEIALGGCIYDSDDNN